MNILYLVAFLFVMLFIINLILIKKSRPKLKKFCEDMINGRFSVYTKEEAFSNLNELQIISYYCFNKHPKIKLDDLSVDVDEIYKIVIINYSSDEKGESKPQRLDRQHTLATQKGWHFPSKGDFPKENKRLLLYTNEIFTGTYHYCPIDGRPDIEPHNWWSDDGLYLARVKAWQYLPEPPKEPD